MANVIIRKRVNITLPQDTLHLIERVAPRSNRSRFLDTAVRFYIKESGRANLHMLMREGAVSRSERDLGLGEEWFPLENEVWQKSKKSKRQR